MKRIKDIPCEITCLKRSEKGAQRDKRLARKEASGQQSAMGAKRIEP